MASRKPNYTLAQDGDVLVIELSGDWGDGVVSPDFTELGNEINSSSVTSLRFDLAGIGNWDSLLPAFMLRCRDFCAGAGIEVAPLSEPQELSDLMGLATATPKHHRAGASERSWLSVATLKTNLHEIGEEVLDSLGFLGDATVACLRAAAPGSATRWVDVRQFLFQSGPDALPIITLTSVLVGMILAYLGAVQLLQFGAEAYVADLVAIGMLREMGALMTAIVMAGRTGAAYAAQLGTMQGNEEIDAVTTLGLSPMEFLVAPRMLALLFTMPLLTIYADLLGVIGGAIVAGGMGISALQYMSQLETALSLTHFLVGLGKSLIFAGLIALAGCRAGMSAGRSSAAVGQATTEAVVTAVVYLIVADAGMNILFQQVGI